ncbi:MAG: YdeI/OmpD-associated family protein [Clostridia bacterium]|nr:YdeI/OmpD-associated family protein [Clostridia bacterium]
MSRIEINPKVDDYLGSLKKWQDEMTLLRSILSGCSDEMKEDVKWGKPCYTLGGSNVALIHEFKDYCAILFIKGALLKDPAGVLIQQTQNVQAARQIRFTHTDEILKLQSTIAEYMAEAIAIEKAGLKVETKKTEEYDIPEELSLAFSEDPAFREAFEKLTPGRQRAYIYFISQAKQSATRTARIEKNRDRILDGLGLND